MIPYFFFVFLLKIKRMKFIFFSILVLSAFSNVNAQCDDSALITYETRAKDTDPNIDWEINKHFSFYNPLCNSKNILVLHMVGTFDNPTNNIMFPSVAANNGYHVISVKYPNSTAAQTACNTSSDLNCYSSFRKEIIEGGDFHPDIDVDNANSIINRALKLLQFLHDNHPTENWDTYYSGNNLNWNKIIVSGHSQGGGHAAYIAKQHQVKRCLMFASPNDYSSNFNSPANWTSDISISPDSIYFGLNNVYDDVVDFYKQFETWDNLGMSLFGDSLNVDITTNYTSSHQLYTQQTGSAANQNHSLMIRDDQTILDVNGKSIFEDVWLYMLGNDIFTSLNETVLENEISVYPNPSNHTLMLSGAYPNTTISIINPDGEIVAYHYDSSNSIDISKLNNGLYFLKIQSSDKTQIIKFIKN